MTESRPPIRILANATAAPIIGARALASPVPDASPPPRAAPAFLAACSPAGAKPRAPQATGGALEDALSIYTWGDYDAPEVLEAFTAELGPKITLELVQFERGAHLEARRGEGHERATTSSCRPERSSRR